MPCCRNKKKPANAYPGVDTDDKSATPPTTAQVEAETKDLNNNPRGVEYDTNA